MQAGKRWWGQVSLAFVGLLAASGAHADIYKCTRQGQVAYQETPCEAGAQQVAQQQTHSGDFVGCWITPDNRNRYPSVWRIEAIGTGLFRRTAPQGSMGYIGSSSVLKPASSEELAMVSSMGPWRAVAGINRHVDAPQPVPYRYRMRASTVSDEALRMQSRQLLEGLYRGQDKSGQTIVFFLAQTGERQRLISADCP
ncbi:hypothetical protein BJI69_19540 [Luteibacter rhizovicinus DSM 16549]|uniref:Uncharacterized protein n=1 Tax=Luteibacter rhizovicinus DSM 16549 TaxID=1440763 RepID=A0A0G9HCH4_9GAMM|nr:DUF4124 domain-containing protein [Luteibacter rhizovicinus]APG05879.1 hypothetical protein BJI69_19540 [Luteibacter rhizovicinus DSM 16549]KLD67171.1 hypothetical protein Y883_09460 [Luteibacter rhizovicinus DSM 16549]